MADEKPESYNRVSLEEQIKAAPDETGFHASQRFIDGLLSTMATRTGRAFVFGLMMIANTDVSPFHPDPHCHAYNTGKQDGAKELKDALVRECFDLYLTMLKEAKEDQDHDDRDSNTGTND